MAKRTYDAGQLSWTVTGWNPFEWRLPRSGNPATGHDACIPPIPAQVPGSVQMALLQAGLLPDWNVGLQAQACEWVENRHWIFTTQLPAGWLHGKHVRLRALGLDYAGWVLINGREVATFTNAFLPHTFDLSEVLPRNVDVTLGLVFACPPRWLGQFGYTAQMTDWKPRFNYTWDWLPRLVQIGIWDDLLLETFDTQEIASLHCTTQVEQIVGTTGNGLLYVQGDILAAGEAQVQITLSETEASGSGEPFALFQGTYSGEEFRAGISRTHLPVKLWYPNGSGEQPLYQVEVALLDTDGVCQERLTRQVGFKAVVWQACEGAPLDADPWLCVVNGQRIFLQGVNWTPIRPNFADVSVEDYRQRLRTYQAMGCNMLRVWGGAFLEKSGFYKLCDELGLLVWQEFPLSSSGVESTPPEDPRSAQTLHRIALSFTLRRQHHVCLLLWAGGNELEERGKPGTPVNFTSPMLNDLKRIVAATDPGRRFLPASPSGPRFAADLEEMGQGLHWDVHAPWIADGDLDADWTRYWQKDDALFRSEIGVPGASSAELIRAFAGNQSILPVNWDNPLWRRTGWWIEYPRFVAEHRRDPQTLDEYVQWSQQRQADALSIAVRACKSRFPRCGGVLIWMGHDAFPCTANTSLLDFFGEPKAGAHAIREIFLTPVARDLDHVQVVKDKKSTT